MRDSELNNAIRGLTSGGCIGLSNEFKSPDKAKELIRDLIKQTSIKTGLHPSILVEDIVRESRLEADAEIARLNAELKRKDVELEQFKAKTKVKPATLGYSKTFAPEVYVEMDKMIRLGYSNRMIAERLNIHPNTVTNRRRKLKNA